MLTNDILSGCAQGDRRAQKALYTYCYPFLYKVALRYSADQDAIVEIITDSFLKVLKNLDQLDAHVAQEAWIRRIGINTSIDRIRSNKKYKDAILLNKAETYDAFEHLYIDHTNAQDGMDTQYIFDILGQLPPLTKEVFNLFAIDGYSHKEIAEMLEVSEEVSRWHVFKGRKFMQEKIIEYNRHNSKIGL